MESLSKRLLRLSATWQRVVGTGSFGIVFQAKCLETGETVAIKKVLQDKCYKNRELQIMRSMDHVNVVSLKHCFFSSTSRDEHFLNLVMEFSCRATSWPGSKLSSRGRSSAKHKPVVVHN